jgi:transposase
VPGAPPRMIRPMTARYRCGSCGNLTRFDVVAMRRTSAFHHYSVGGDLTVEEEELLEERVERVTCRWCGASGDTIEVLPGDEAAAPAEPA